MSAADAGKAAAIIFAQAFATWAKAYEDNRFHSAFGSAAWLAGHAPASLEKLYAKSWLTDRVTKNDSLQMVVLSADIRRSTFLMKEAVNPVEHARILNRFVAAAQETVKKRDGWFDKFMGDGFLAFWIYDDAAADAAAARALASAREIIGHFEAVTSKEFARNSRNWPASVGLSCGLDAGPAHIVMVAREPTILGHPVVGAVRMQGAARPSEVVANVGFATKLRLDVSGRCAAHHVQVHREERPTKEYQPQVVFSVGTEPLPPSYVVPPWPIVGASTGSPKLITANGAPPTLKLS